MFVSKFYKRKKKADALSKPQFRELFPRLTAAGNHNCILLKSQNQQMSPSIIFRADFQLVVHPNMPRI